jgi:hypothetical protein
MKCMKAGCDRPSTASSNYCAVHRGQILRLARGGRKVAATKTTAKKAAAKRPAAKKAVARKAAKRA